MRIPDEGHTLILPLSYWILNVRTEEDTGHSRGVRMIIDFLNISGHQPLCIIECEEELTGRTLRFTLFKQNIRMTLRISSNSTQGKKSSNTPLLLSQRQVVLGYITQVTVLRVVCFLLLLG